MKDIRHAAKELAGSILAVGLVILALSLPFIITGENASEHWPVMMPDGEGS